MRGIIPLLVFGAGVLAAPPLSAQQTPPPPVTAAPAAPVIDMLVLGRRTDRMTVPVSIGANGPFHFIIDTGAERSVVSRELAGYLKLAPGGEVRLFDFSGPADVPTVKVPSLSAGKLGVTAIEAPQLAMNDIGAPGMLGIDALQGQRVIFDFQGQRLFLKPARRHPFGQYLIPVASRTGQLIVTKATYNGQPISVVIDTGSWLSVGNSAMLKLARKPPSTYGSVTALSVTGRKFTAAYTLINDLQIGSMVFGNFGMVFADVPPFERFGLADKPALILGMSSLRLFGRVELDFVNREIAFTPRQSLDRNDICRGGSRACSSVTVGD